MAEELGRKPSGDLILIKLGELVTEAWASWNILTTVILVLFSMFLLYPVLFQRDPDTHPLLLSRQSDPAPVRRPGESSVYRSQNIPYGISYISGLNIKAPGASVWSRGRDGSLGDIWIQALKGLTDSEGISTGKRGSLYTVHGKETVLEHSMDEISKAIAIMGKYFGQTGAQRVAIYLPNSIEYLVTIFATLFHGQVPILVPYNLPHANTVDLLEVSKADLLVAAAGSLPLQELVSASPKVKHIVWVTDQGNRHMGWSDVPAHISGAIDISVWQEVIEDRAAAETGALPDALNDAQSPTVVSFWSSTSEKPFEMVEFSQGQLVAAVGAQLVSIPRQSARLSPADLFFPADSLSTPYVLVLTLVALYSNASVVFNSVAGRGVDFRLATRKIAPTVVVASAETMKKLHDHGTDLTKGLLTKLSVWSQSRTLSEGTLPGPSFLNGFGNPFRSPNKPGCLRLIYTFERSLSPDCPRLSSITLSDLRIFTGARIIYALTASKVAGAVAQTKLYDYRVLLSGKDHCSHFGAPLGSLDVKLVDTAAHKSVEGKDPEGEIVVTGPAVIGGEARLGVNGTFRGDHTLAYVY
ncbi:MAG: hypothetical protein M1814_001657 [Vezdaea aestivalis]|nr:MAG: hypothetical protein M1814_001657 [Vezdaea aestivalis]